MPRGNPPPLGAIAKANGYVDSSDSSFSMFNQASGNSGSGASGGTVRNIGHGLTCNCGGQHSIQPRPDGSLHVNHHVDGASFSCNVAKDGAISGWHGHVIDQTKGGQDLIIERKK